jgi:cell division protein FtsN
MSKFDKTGKVAARSDLPRKKKSGGGTLLGIFIGLVIGILIAFGVVWYLNKSPLPFQNKYEGAPKADKPATAATALPCRHRCPASPATSRPSVASISTTSSKASSRRAAWHAAGAPTPAPAPGTTPPPADRTGCRSRAGRRRSGGRCQASAQRCVLPSGRVVPEAADADNLKAKLALTGLYASVQEVNIPDKGTMHRVRVGPFRDPDEMNRARALLAQNGVQASVVKQKE